MEFVFIDLNVIDAENREGALEPDAEYSPLLCELFRRGLVLEKDIGTIPQDDETKQRIRTYEHQEMTLIQAYMPYVYKRIKFERSQYHDRRMMVMPIVIK